MNKVCTACGYVGKPRKMTRGSFLVELFLWCLLLVPGIIYSVWRVSSRYEVCSNCLVGAMIPLNSPNGQNIVNQNKSN